jgi:glycosyltransferase involved in cell wall biosynthesis
MEFSKLAKPVAQRDSENGCENTGGILSAKKILVLTDLYPPQELGGYGRLMFDFANILARRGHNIRVLTSDAPYLGATPENEPGIDRRLVSFVAWKNGEMKWLYDNEKDILEAAGKNNETIQSVIDDFSPDLCLLGNINSLYHLIFRPLLKRDMPIIHHLGNLNPGYPVDDPPTSEIYVPAAASQWLKEQVLTQGHNFQDFPVIYPGALVKEFKTQVLPDMNKLRIAYASIMLPYKGPHVLINALKILHNQGVDFTCSLAGTSMDHDFVDTMKKFVSDNGMEEKVSFVGFLQREELKNFFARHNVLAFPSIFQEPFGISQVEAMASGLTVVSSGTGGIKEIVEHDKSGLVFKSKDYESLAQELLSLTQDKERWRRLAIAGQKRAMKHFDIEKSVDDLERIFYRLLNKVETCTANA